MSYKRWEPRRPDRGLESRRLSPRTAPVFPPVRTKGAAYTPVRPSAETRQKEMEKAFDCTNKSERKK